MDNIKIKIINDIAIIVVDLLVATQRDAKPFWDELESKSILDWEKIIIDISSCTFVDSTFIGIIARIHKRVSDNDGQLKLVFPEKKAMIYLYTLGITRMIDCFNTLRQAVDSFDSEIPIRKISFEEELQKDLPTEPLKFKLE